jgi:hypothetical protein
MDLHQITELVGAIVTVASLVSNYVAPWTYVGRALHFLALNGPTIQAAVKSAADAKK